MTTADGLLDEAYERLHAKGPEFEGWLSNHGPMAVDALLRLGHGDDVHRWVVGYEKRLEPMPAASRAIAATDWREALGDPSRLGDWMALFARQVHEEPWEQLLVRWWPRLLPGALASLTHGVIRTGHVVRALRDGVTTARLDELGQALGYWAARWQPLPPAGAGARAEAAQAVAPTDVPRALDDLTDAAVSRYPRWAASSPVLLVHTATAPRAVALALPSLPVDLWQASYDVASALTAAIGAAHGRMSPTPDLRAADADVAAPHDLADLVSRNDDEHVIKFVEVAAESQRRGNPDAVAAARSAARLIGAPR